MEVLAMQFVAFSLTTIATVVAWVGFVYVIVVDDTNKLNGTVRLALALVAFILFGLALLATYVLMSVPVPFQ